jgi:general nucleoside transport system ATP-binding protein
MPDAEPIEPAEVGAPTRPALRLRGISKHFGPLTANDDISLHLHAGEVLALLGENGAGKSTLVSILFGHLRADAGTIEVDGKPLPAGDTAAALAAGIGMVHQHFTLADNLSVLDNVMLGTEPLWQPFSRRRAARERLLATAQRFGLAVDPDALVAELSMGERQRVEILKALVRGARILILDEPTAVLTPGESEALFTTLAHGVAQGLAVIFISHKLDEVLRVSQRIVVLRAGRRVLECASSGASRNMLAAAMVGGSVAAPVRPARPAAGASEPVLELAAVSFTGAGGKALLQDVNLAVHAGEVVAIAGVAGNGQQALAALLGGGARPSAGTLRCAGGSIARDPRAWIAAGVARIPEDRSAIGLIGEWPLWQNLMLERHRRPAFARGPWLRRAGARRHAATLIERFDVRGTLSRGADTPARALSGGNMQKLILARALAGDPEDTRPPRLIIANQPTWGLDVGAVAAVHQRLLDAGAAGSAVLLISEDLDEIFVLADRIAVMHAGRLTAAEPAAAWSRAGIGLAMAGGAAVRTAAA